MECEEELNSYTEESEEKYVIANGKCFLESLQKRIDDLKKLVKDPSIWTDDLLEHIFYGNKAGGYHYAGLKGANGYITEVTKAPNKYGVYEADTFVCGKKRLKKSFFPDGWTPQQVIETEEDAFKNGKNNAQKNFKVFTMESGVEIQVN